MAFNVGLMKRRVFSSKQNDTTTRPLIMLVLALVLLEPRQHNLTILTVLHYNDVIMGPVASQITSLMIVYSDVYSGADEGKYQSFASLAFGRGNHRWPVISWHKGLVTQKMFPFDDVIMGPRFFLHRLGYYYDCCYQDTCNLVVWFPWYQ